MSALLDAARELKPEGSRSLTYMTLFGLLASTGMRLSEAVHLKEADVNLKQPAVTVRETKFKKSRLVPIHASTAQSLAAYQDATRSVLRGTGVETVFLPAAGQSLPMRTIHSTFDSLRRRLGWVARGGHPHPRIHDLRHTFIYRAMWRSQQGGQVDRDVNIISTYVGHAKSPTPTGTSRRRPS